MSLRVSPLRDSGAAFWPALGYALLANGLQVYGLLVLGWHFFPILFLWWWEIVFISLFGVFKLWRLRPFLRAQQTEVQIKAGEQAARSRFFMLFIYLVFIVILGGFVFAPRRSHLPNLEVLFFANTVFSLNLLWMILVQSALFWRDYFPTPTLSADLLDELRTPFDLRMGVLHAGLLLGAFFIYLCKEWSLPSTHAFMFGFMAIKTLVELWVIARPSKSRSNA